MKPSSGQSAVRFVAALLVLAIVAWGAFGAGIASGQSEESYAVRQGDQCTPITPLSGDEPVLEFYGYQSTFEDNPYTTSIGPSFSSEGTLDLQVPETSLLFLYEDPGGNLSLVMVHGSREGGVDGGSASFDLSGLPADGRWAVKDDDYDSPNNEDTWTHGGTTAEIDWTWSRSATDGGAFSGLGDEFNVTIDPAFNGEAELFGVSNFGVVDNWTALSGDTERPDRTSLDLEENVTISTEPCAGAATTPDDESTGTTTPSDDDGDGVEADDGEEEGDDRGSQGVGDGGDRDRDDERGDGPPFDDDERGDGPPFDDDERGDGPPFGDEERDRDGDRDDDDRGDGFPFGDGDDDAGDDDDGDDDDGGDDNEDDDDDGDEDENEDDDGDANEGEDDDDDEDENEDDDEGDDDDD